MCEMLRFVRTARSEFEGNVATTMVMKQVSIATMARADYSAEHTQRRR